MSSSCQPSRCKQHIHIDNPTSAFKILESCRSMGDGREEERGLLQYLSDLGLLSPNEEGWNSLSLGDGWESVLRREVEDFETTEPTKGINSCVIVYAAEALSLLNQHGSASPPHNRFSASSKSIDYCTEFAVVASIWWILQRFEATSVTFSPLSCTMSTARHLSNLLRGLQVQIVDDDDDELLKEERPALEPDGAVLCRALMGVSFTSVPPITMRHMGSVGGTTVVVGALSKVTSGITSCTGMETPTESDTLDSRQSTSTELSQLERPYWNVHRELSLLEANIDDMSGEQLAFAAERLLTDPDCLDVWLTPIIMKKGRPAHTLHCLVHNSQMQPLIVEIFHLTTTLGVRVQNQHSGLSRVALRRVMIEVPVGGGETDIVRCKVGYIGPQVCSVKPEFEDCKKVAIRNHMSLDQVTFEATAKARIKLNKQQAGTG